MVPGTQACHTGQAPSKNSLLEESNETEGESPKRTKEKDFASRGLPAHPLRLHIHTFGRQAPAPAACEARLAWRPSPCPQELTVWTGSQDVGLEDGERHAGAKGLCSLESTHDRSPPCPLTRLLWGEASPSDLAPGCQLRPDQGKSRGTTRIRLTSVREAVAADTRVRSCSWLPCQTPPASLVPR